MRGKITTTLTKSIYYLWFFSKVSFFPRLCKPQTKTWIPKCTAVSLCYFWGCCVCVEQSRVGEEGNIFIPNGLFSCVHNIRTEANDYYLSFWKSWKGWRVLKKVRLNIFSFFDLERCCLLNINFLPTKVSYFLLLPVICERFMNGSMPVELTTFLF